MRRSSPGAASPATSFRHPALIGALVAALGALAFTPALGGAFVWDDVPLIVGNARIRSPQSLADLLLTPFWDVSFETEVDPAYARLHRPVVKLAYHLQFLAFGEEPLGFHLVGLLLHAACVWLVFDALRARIARADDAGILAAGIGAALFALHPTRAESVAWISGSTDLWMTFFLLLGARALRDAASPAKLVLGGLALALAGFAKEPALLAPLLVVGDGIARDEPRALLARKGAVSIAAAALVVAVAAAVVPSIDEGLEVEISPARVVATLGHYLALVVWPHPPSVFPAVVASTPDATYDGLALVLGAAVLLAFLGLAIGALRRPALRPWLADALWFLVPLAPLLNVLVRSRESLVSERFLYLPLFGICALVARGLAELLARAPARRAVVGASAIVLLGAGLASRASAERFVSARALWTHELEVSPALDHVHLQLVEALRAEQDFEGATQLALGAASLARQSGRPDLEARFLLTWASLRLTMLSDAEQEELLALRAMYDQLVAEPRLALVAPTVAFDLPLPAEAHAALRDDLDLVVERRATAHLRTGSLERAQELLRAVVAERPRRPGAWNLLTVVRARRGDFDGALEASSAAERIFPGSAEVRGTRDAVLRARARAEQPVASELEARVRDAEVQVLLGAPEAARRALDPVLEAYPTEHRLVHLRAQIDVSDRRFDLAREVIERAREQAPGDPFFDAALEALAAAEVEASRRGGASAPR